MLNRTFPVEQMLRDSSKFSSFFSFPLYLLIQRILKIERGLLLGTPDNIVRSAVQNRLNPNAQSI
jgi:hypothetical protein